MQAGTDTERAAADAAQRVLTLARDDAQVAAIVAEFAAGGE